MPTFNTYTSLTAADTADVLAIWDTSAGTLNNITVGQLFASPGPIGSTTPSTGAFTTLDVSGAITTLSTITTRGNVSVTSAGQPSVSLNFSGTGDPSIRFANGAGGSLDTVLTRDNAANTLAMRNGANAQTFSVYGAYTDTSNYRRFRVTQNTSGTVTLYAEGAGTGAAGNEIHIRAVDGIQFSNAGSDRFYMSGSGHLRWNAHNTYDIGSLTNAPKSVYAGTSMVVGSSLGVTVTTDGSNNALIRPSTNVVRISGNSGTGDDRLIFGLVGTAHPALKRSGTSLQVRLADDSADAPLSTGDLTIGGGTPIKKVLSAVASVTLDSGGSQAANTSITVTGAAVGDVVAISLPVGWVSPNYIWTAAVNSANTVIIQVSTIDGSGFTGTASIRATVIKH